MSRQYKGHSKRALHVMTMKKVMCLVVLFFLLASCAGLKFKPYYDDVDYLERHGDIKYVEYMEFSEAKPNDTSKIGIEYNESNLPSKQIDFGKGKRGNQEVTLIYDQDSRLIEQIPNSPRAPWHYKFTYDSKGNLINQKGFTNDTLTFERRLFYDKNNNPIKEERYKKQMLVEESYYDNDYKKRTSTATFYNKGIKSTTSSKNYYDKKGNIILVEAVINGKINSRFITYDKFGNVVTVERETEKTLNVHTYDDKHNLVKTLVYIKGKLFRTEMYTIHYK